MRYFHSWSGGKDSTAGVILDHIHGLPPSTIVFSEVMFDRKRGISGERPEHIDFIKNKAKPLFESWGYTVEILHAEKDYLDCFFRVLEKSKDETAIGKYKGWVIAGMCDANRDLKLKPIHRSGWNAYAEQIKYRFLKDTGTQNKWRLICVKNTTFFPLYMSFRGAAGAGFARMQRSESLRKQKEIIRICGQSFKSWTEWKTQIQKDFRAEDHFRRSNDL